MLDKAVANTAAGIAITADTMDVIAGFDEYPVLSTCIKYAAIEESDPSVYMAQLGSVKESIRAAVRERDVGEPDRIRDVYQEGLLDYGWPTYDKP